MVAAGVVGDRGTIQGDVKNSGGTLAPGSLAENTGNLQGVPGPSGLCLLLLPVVVCWCQESVAREGGRPDWLMVIGASQAVRNFTVKFRSRARRIVPLYDLVPRADAKWAGNGLVMGWPYLGVV